MMDLGTFLASTTSFLFLVVVAACAVVDYIVIFFQLCDNAAKSLTSLRYAEAVYLYLPFLPI